MPKLITGDGQHGKAAVARDAGLAAESSATPLKFSAESINFGLHASSPLKQLTNLVPILVP